MAKIAVIYWSGTGNTETMANAVVEGINEAGGTAELFQVSDFDKATLGDYEAFALGCPAMGSEELEYDEFQPFWDDTKELYGDRKVVLFGSYEWADGEWMETWRADADAAGVNVVDTLIVYDAPDAEGEASAQVLGAKLV
ncbi:flavodoxin [Collinsella sp. AGMB00827]|uniref:Flavodoxin n=1 Tax=Collinsella ureilytica TaxID=2869515 RepID=A0ABS7MHR1_9ACTN|nr:flavodoxin [Collinsella urealyticum]MBY4796891.1 flavodoxin [Collinsella urealyticum]